MLLLQNSAHTSVCPVKVQRLTEGTSNGGVRSDHYFPSGATIAKFSLIDNRRQADAVFVAAAAKSTYFR